MSLTNLELASSLITDLCQAVEAFLMPWRERALQTGPPRLRLFGLESVTPVRWHAVRQASRAAFGANPSKKMIWGRCGLGHQEVQARGSLTNVQKQLRSDLGSY